MYAGAPSLSPLLKMRPPKTFSYQRADRPMSATVRKWATEIPSLGGISKLFCPTWTVSDFGSFVIIPEELLYKDKDSGGVSLRLQAIYRPRHGRPESLIADGHRDSRYNEERRDGKRQNPERRSEYKTLQPAVHAIPGQRKSDAQGHQDERKKVPGEQPDDIADTCSEDLE